MRVAASGWILLAGLAAQPALFGQVQPAVAPPVRLDGPRLALAAAVDQTLRDSPDLHQAEAVLAERRGAERSARGAFDGVLSAVPRLNYQRLSLTPTQLQAEVNRRLRFELPAEKLDQAAIAIVQAKPTDASLLFSDCRLANTVIRVEIGEGKPPAFICFDSNDQVIGFVLDGQDLGFSSIGISALRRLELFNLLQKNGVSISLDTQETLAAFSDLIRFLSRQLHIAADSLRVQRGWLGSVPIDEETFSFATDLSYQWRHRAGVALTAMLSLQSSEDNFAGKPLDPVFGDTLNPNVHTATLGLTLDLPLGKGRGRVSADAPEKAAKAAAEAAEHLIDQTAAEQALATVQAYLEVAAAEERLELQETSVSSLERIDQGTRELQRADQVAAIEVTRAAGRLAQAQAGLADARQKLEVARLGLQRAMGAPSVPLAEAPLAAQSLADLLAQDSASGVEPDAVVSSALASRFDLQAATKLSESNQILLAASRADLKRQVDLSLNASYNGLHESFSDRWYDMRGFNRAMSGVVAGPSYGLTLRFALPFGNNAAYGRMVQADAQFARSEISRVDLGRTIRSRVLQTLAALERSRLAVAAARAAASYADETFASSVERFKGGELSIIDTLTTEDQVTSARLALVEASRSHLSLLAQLRFEANALLLATPGSGESHGFQLAPLGAPLR